MTSYSPAELDELRLIDRFVRAELKRRGLPLLDKRPVDEIIASGAFKAAECRVQSMEMVTPGWAERARRDE